MKRFGVLLPLLLSACASPPSDDPYEALSRKIHRQEPELREEARVQLVHLGGPRAVEILSRETRTDSEELLLQALGALASLSDEPDAIAVLLPFFKHPSVVVRREATRLAAYDENPRWIAPLMEGATDPDAELRRTCLESLEWRSLPEALPRFKAALLDPDPTTRDIAQRGLFKLEWLERSRELRYYAPDSTPFPKGSREEEEYSQGHRAAWVAAINSLTLDSIVSGNLIWAVATCCEAPPSVTKGWSSGQKDVSGFLNGLKIRVVQEPELRLRLLDYRREVGTNPVPLLPKK